MVRFEILKDDFYIGDSQTFKGGYKMVDTVDGTLQYELTNPELKSKLDFLQELGYIQMIRDEQRVIQGVDDILRLTESVEMLTGGQMHLKVHLAGNQYDFTEAETDNGRKLRRSLIRTGVVLSITLKEWNTILAYWLDIAVRKSEMSDDADVAEEVLNYLRSSRIHTDIKQTLGRRHIYYDPAHPEVVLCSTDLVMKYLDRKDKRKMSSILSDYLEGQSVQKYVSKERKRYWVFNIERCGLNLEEQMVDLEDVFADDVMDGMPANGNDTGSGGDAV